MNEKLREQLIKEKEFTQSNRIDFIKRKLVFITSLFGIGTINFESASFYPILYVIPFLALGYDLYILVEDFKIKRIGEFLKVKDEFNKDWEDWVTNNKNPYATLPAPLFTLITILGAAIIIIQNIELNCLNTIIVVVWFFITLILTLILYNKSKKTRKIFKN